MPGNNTKDEDEEDECDDDEETSIVNVFDRICFTRGEDDAICLSRDGESFCYLELQELSKALACQLHYRYRPDYVLVECFGHVVAEAVSVLACLRLKKPFVPVSVLDQHAGGRLNVLADALRKQQQPQPQDDPHCSSSTRRTRSTRDSSLVAICCCEDDQDPALGVFYAAGIHTILFIDRTGNMREQMRVPSTLPETITASRRRRRRRSEDDDDMYILFTSGTSGASPKAVVGSQQSTWRRLAWFHERFPAACSRVARRTRLTFVDGITELLTPLTSTSTSSPSVLVAVEPYQLQQEGMALLLDRMQPTQITLLPSQLSMLLSSTNSPTKLLASLDRIIISGEVCSVALWEQFQRLFHTANNNNTASKTTTTTRPQLINLYGQTETTGDVLCAVLTDMDPENLVVNGVVAVGKPILPDSGMIHITTINNTTMNVAAELTDTNADSTSNNNNNINDDRDAIVAGELIVSGSNLSNGYLAGIDDGDDDDKLQPFTSFATGDVGFCRNDVWYVQGRCNEVEKINGIMTSPSEAEAVFQKFYKLNDAPPVAATIIDGSLYLVSESAGEASSDDFTMGPPIFSREAMNKAGHPWNLIPKRVFYGQSIPRSSTGAGKVNRVALKDLVRGLLLSQSDYEDNSHKQEPSSSLSTTSLGIEVDLIVAKVLQLGEGVVVDKTKSFVELGGDSASAINLLYQLRLTHAEKLQQQSRRQQQRTKQQPSEPQQQQQQQQQQQPLVPKHLHLTAVDILMADSISDLKRVIISGGDSPSNGAERRNPTAKKRPRLEVQVPEFVPQPIERFNGLDEPQFHCAIKFAACVDGSPSLAVRSCSGSNDNEDGMFYSACQGGVIQKISALSGDVVAHRHFPGWMFQADCIPTDKAVFAFGHSRLPDRGGGLVVSLSLDLQSVFWQRQLDSGSDNVGGGGITCTPIIMRRGASSKLELWVTNEKRLHVLDIETGHSRACLDLPEPFHVTAKVDTSRGTVLYAGSSLFKVSAAERQSPNELENDELGARFAPDEKASLRGQALESNISMGPVYKAFIQLSSSHTLIADSWGYLHLLNAQSMVGTSLKVSNYPLTSPTKLVPVSLPSSSSFSSASSSLSIIVVGAFCGTVTYLLEKDDQLCRMCDFDAGATLYARPLALPDGSCVVCTTAGDVIRIKHHHTDSSTSNNEENDRTVIKQLCRRRVFAEIWSEPVLLVQETTASSAYRIAFGARDSKVHIISLGIDASL